MDTPSTIARYELEVDESGQLSVPPEILTSLGLREGNTVTLLRTTTGVMLIPDRLLMPEIAEYASKLMAERGITVDDVLAGLDSTRERLFQERYGDFATP